jgi:hypothetical protein
MSDKTWGRRLLPPLVVGGMMACIAMSAAEFIHLVAPDWNGALLIVMPVLATVTAHHSNRLAHQRYLSGTELFRFQAIELLTLFIVIKVAGYLDNTWAELIAEARGWGQNPSSFFDTETLFTFALTCAGWFAAWSTADDVEELSDSTRYEGRDSSRPMTRLQGKFFLGGFCLLLFAGLTRAQIGEMLKIARPNLPGLALNALLYFVGGLVILGRLHFIRQERLWRAQKTSYAPILRARWTQYTLILLGVVLVVAFLLPTGYTIGFLELLRLVINALAYLLSLLFFLAMLPLSYLLTLFNVTTPFPELPPMPEPLASEPLSPAGTTPNPWWEVLRSALFWLIAVGRWVRGGTTEGSAQSYG